MRDLDETVPFRTIISLPHLSRFAVFKRGGASGTFENDFKEECKRAATTR
jgi:hypothetical protein